MSEPTIFSDTFLAMGSHCELVLPNVEAEFAKEVLHQVKAELEKLENSISRFSIVSSIWEVNNSPKDQWIEVSPELWEILTISHDFYQMSNGAFDVTVFPLQNLWSENKTPQEAEVEAARKKCGFDKIEFDFDNKKIRFKADDMELDFGAIEKGFALDIINPLLIELGVKDGIVSFEEDIVLSIGKHPSADFWPLGIRNQQKPNEFLHVFQTSNQNVTSAGTVYIRDDGQGMKQRTVISPATGFPVEGKKTVSVKADSATMGAFISNVWLILPENDKNILAEQFKNIEILEVEYLDDDVCTKLSILNGEDE